MSLSVSVLVAADDFAVFEYQADVVVGGAAVDGGAVEADDAVDAVAHGGGEDFAVGDVHFAVAADGGDVFDAESEVGFAGAFKADFVGSLHELFERLHGPAHFGVVERADVEIEILERLGAHLGHLGHRRMRPAEDAPAGFGDADVVVDFFPDGGFVEFLLVGGDVGKFGDVGVAAGADVALRRFSFAGVRLRR